jgi:hypothetical protein
MLHRYRRAIFCRATLLVTILTAVTVCNAGILTTSAGVVVLGSPPPSVELNQLESNTDIFVFQERANFTLPAPLPVDVTLPGTYDELSDAPPPPSFLPPGMVVNSYFVHADADLPLLSTGFVTYPNRSITFDPTEVVIGIQFRNLTLILSHPLIGAPGTAYPPPPLSSGLNLADIFILPTDDSFILSADRRTVTFNLAVGSGIDGGGVDQARIITQTIPEPSSLALGGLGLLLLAGARHLRARK